MSVMLAIMRVLVNWGFVTTKFSGNPLYRITLPRELGGCAGRLALPVNDGV